MSKNESICITLVSVFILIIGGGKVFSVFDTLKIASCLYIIIDVFFRLYDLRSSKLTFKQKMFFKKYNVSINRFGMTGIPFWSLWGIVMLLMIL